MHFWSSPTKILVLLVLSGLYSCKLIVLTFDLFAIFNNLFFPYFQRVSYNKFSATRTAAPINFWPHARLRFSEILSTRARVFFMEEQQILRIYSLHIKVHSLLKQFVAQFSVKLYDKEQIGVKEPFPMTNLPIYFMNVGVKEQLQGDHKVPSIKFDLFSSQNGLINI